MTTILSKTCYFGLSSPLSKTIFHNLHLQATILAPFKLSKSLLFYVKQLINLFYLERELGKFKVLEKVRNKARTAARISCFATLLKSPFGIGVLL